MEQLILHVGRFIPRTDADTETRLRAVEAHVAALTAELELLLTEMGAAAADNAPETPARQGDNP